MTEGRIKKMFCVDCERWYGHTPDCPISKVENCCLEGFKIDYFWPDNPRQTDKICPDHADLGARNRAKRWVESALHQIDNGSTTKELREFYLK